MSNWGSFAEWASAIVAFLTFCVACAALESWRKQLRGGSEYEVAKNVAIAARTLRYAFYDSRSVMFWAWEFPPDYHTRNPQLPKSRSVEAKDYEHAYNNRWKDLWPHILKLAELRSEAGAIISDNVATAIESLARKARELHFMMEQHVEQIAAGPEIVAKWGDQEFAERVRKCVVTPNREDPLSQEFEHEFEVLLALLRGYL